MAIKPGTLCTLEKDKLIDTQQGFVDTFNWVVASVNNLKGGQNCEVTWPAPDTPQIDAEATESEGGGGGDGGGNVEDVSSETYQNGESLLIEYADDTPDAHIPLSFVKDVSSDTYQNGESLKVEYSNGNADAHIPLSFVKDVSSETYQGSPAIKVEYSNGDQASHISLPTVSGETVDVITDISFDFDNNNQLVATLTKKRVTVIDKNDLTDGTAGLKLWKYNVVISSSYNSTGDHKFKNKVTGGIVTNASVDTSTTSENEVFTSTAHSSE